MINVTIGESKTKSEKPFPKLMISKTGSIILAISSSRYRIAGAILEPGSSPLKLGDYSSWWEKENFTDYNAPITLQNA